MKKKILIVYIACFLGIAALPFYGLLFHKSDEPIGNEEQAEAPALKKDGKFNVSFLNDAGNYFEQKMAFRDAMISLDTRIASDLFHESANDQVIVGKNGWLYYADSLDDYQGVNLLSERALYNVAYNVHMMQEYVERQGGKFVFTVAPNKNSLYPQNMPYYNKAKYSDEKNITNLIPYFEKLGVNYIDLFSVFEDEDEILYHKTDSHWTNAGAVLAYDRILSSLEKEHESYKGIKSEERADFIGDLEEMLHPLDQKAEKEIYYDKEFSYTYVNDVKSTFDPLIYTENKKGSDTLLMYRDSFGNALVPFMADAFSKAEFSRAEPYYLAGDYTEQDADIVVVERAERFLKNIAGNPAVTEQPKLLMDQGYETEANNTTLTVKEPVGNYDVFEGIVDDSLVDADAKIYLRIDHKYAYEASPMTTEDGNDYGYRLYLDQKAISPDEAEVEVLVVNGGKTYLLGRYDVSVDEASVSPHKVEKGDYTVTEDEGYLELGKKSKKTVQYHIYNRTGKTIKKLYIAAEDAEEFGKNLLKKGRKILDDEEFLLNCNKKYKGKFWIKVEYKDGSECIFKNMSLSDVTFFELYQSGKKYSYIRYQKQDTYKIKSNKQAVKERVKKEEEEAARKAAEEAARKAAEEAARKAAEEAARKAASQPAASKKPSGSGNSGGKYIVRKEKVYDCDGSGNFYYIIHYSDGSTSIQ